MKEYIMKAHGFQEKNMYVNRFARNYQEYCCDRSNLRTFSTILMDDGRHTSPTYKNIMQAYQQLVNDAEPGDAVFCHYSGKCI